MAYYSELTPSQEALLTKSIDAAQEELIQSLQSLIRIPSVKAAPTPGGPFGAPINAALEKTLALAERLGFQTRNLDGYVGLVEYGGGEETLGVLAHLDVVPEGEGWTLPAFGGEIRDGILYGRGATDDKGPALNALYALYAIKEAGIPLGRRVQLIFGTDEESGWGCMNYFKEKEPLPQIAFSPDGEYPLVFSERAIVQATYEADAAGTSVRVECGERANVVPGSAHALLPLPPTQVAVPEGFSLELSKAEQGVSARVGGLGAHASTPEVGRNALQLLLCLLQTLPLEGRDAQIANTLHAAFKMEMHGEGLGLDTEDESGRLTINPGILHWDEEKVRFTIDARVPRSLATDALLARVKEALAPAGFTLAHTHVQKGHFVDINSELVQKLLGVYRAQTGDVETPPLAIGGGTYARAMPMAVAFGCEYPNDPMLAHMPDECVSLERIRQNTHMMADAIVALAGK